MSSFDEDMKLMKKQVTQEVIFHINKTPSLYSDIVEARDVDDPDVALANVQKVVDEYTESHDDWFGTVFKPELDVVDWWKVIDQV